MKFGQPSLVKMVKISECEIDKGYFPVWKKCLDEALVN